MIIEYSVSLVMEIWDDDIVKNISFCFNYFILKLFTKTKRKKKKKRRKRKLGYFIIEWLTAIQLQSNDNDLEAENFALLLFISNCCDYLSLNSTVVGVSEKDIYIFCDDGSKYRSLFSSWYYWKVSQILN